MESKRKTNSSSNSRTMEDTRNEIKRLIALEGDPKQDSEMSFLNSTTATIENSNRASIKNSTTASIENSNRASIKNSTTASIENNPLLHNVESVDTETVKTAIQISDQCLEADEDDAYVRGPCVKCMESMESGIGRVYTRFKTTISRGLKVVIFLLYAAYFIYCMYYRFGDEGSIVLLVGTILLLLYLIKKFLASKGCSCGLSRTFSKYSASKKGNKARRVIRYGLYVTTTAGFGLFLGFDVLRNNPQNCQSILGIVVLILACLILSKKPSRINWHPVFWGFILQFLFAFLTLRTEFGYGAFKWVGDCVVRLVEFSYVGIAFGFGENFKSMGLAITALGVLIFFNSIIYLLIHWGVLEVIVIKLGSLLGFCLDTGPVESMNAVVNIFMGLHEVGLFIRPFMKILSKSELCSIITAGFASISATFLGIFILLGVPGNHLLTASVISAPAALALTKIVYPETERTSVALQSNFKLRDDADKRRNVLSVCADGAQMGMKALVPVAVNMIAFISLLHMINVMLDWLGERAGIEALTFDKICSYLLFPLAYVMGAAPEDCGRVGSLIGIKLFATPLFGYIELSKNIKNRRILEDYIANSNGTWHWSGSDIILDSLNQTLISGVMSERSEIIAAYAMCGFSAITGIGVALGLMTTLCPERRQDVTDVVLRAFFAGNVANFVTGAVAGIMLTD